MKKLQNLLLLSITFFMINITTGCSSHNDIISVSEEHLYNTNYGIAQDDYADQQINLELQAMNEPTQVEMPTHLPKGWTTELTKDPDAFYEDEFVPQPEVITYKYKFDKKFYNHAEWRSSEM